MDEETKRARQMNRLVNKLVLERDTQLALQWELDAASRRAEAKAARLDEKIKALEAQLVEIYKRALIARLEEKAAEKAARKKTP